MAKGPIRGYFSRSRSLADFNLKFGKNTVEKTLEEAIKNEEKVRLLEIGCGEGRVLMELRKLFPAIEIHGINKKPWAAMKGQGSLRRTGTYYKIFSRKEIESVDLPKIHFYDATKLRFKDNFFDVVISQVSIYQVARKDTILEEIWRVLKQSGTAFLDVDNRHEGDPDFLNHTTPRFMIYQGDKLISLKDFAGYLKKIGYNINYGNSCEYRNSARIDRAILTMHKNKPKLNLNLEFDELSSFDLGVLCKRVNGHDIAGYRSVYNQKE